MPIRQATKRYLVVGVSVYALELLVIYGATSAGLPPTWAVALSFTLGFLVSFILQKFFTFGDRRMHHKILAKQTVVYALLVLVNFCFTIAVTALLTPMIPAVVTRTIALATTTIWNFFLYKTKIFSANADDNPVY